MAEGEELRSDGGGSVEEEEPAGLEGQLLLAAAPAAGERLEEQRQPLDQNSEDAESVVPAAATAVGVQREQPDAEAMALDGGGAPAAQQQQQQAGLPQAALAATADALDEAEPARARHHLLRHSLPDEDRGLAALRHFGCDNARSAVRKINKMPQKELQARGGGAGLDGERGAGRRPTAPSWTLHNSPFPDLPLTGLLPARLRRQICQQQQLLAEEEADRGWVGGREGGRAGGTHDGLGAVPSLRQACEACL